MQTPKQIPVQEVYQQRLIFAIPQILNGLARRLYVIQILSLSEGVLLRLEAASAEN
jgi:hypothetical protein